MKIETVEIEEYLQSKNPSTHRGETRKKESNLREMPRKFCAKNKQEVSVVFLKLHSYNSLKLQIRQSFLAYKEYKYKLNLHSHTSTSIYLVRSPSLKRFANPKFRKFQQ